MSRGKVIRDIRQFVSVLARQAEFGRMFTETGQTQAPVYLPRYLQQVIGERLRVREPAYWPMHGTSVVQNATGVVLGYNTAPGIMPGCYVQGIGGVFVGSNTRIGPHVGIHSVNHSPENNLVDDAGPVRIGRSCWLGMGVQVLPGVELGDFTTVGAGAVVTKSFPEGYCVLVGNPARPLRQLDRAKCVVTEPPFRWHGFIPEAKFEKFRAACLRF